MMDIFYAVALLFKQILVVSNFKKNYHNIS